MSVHNRDYRFDIQLAEGLAAEGWFYELTKGGDRFEVKHDRLALETGNVYVERENNPGHEGWKPSGIETTEADCWIFVIGIPPAAFIGIETSQLRTLVQNVGRAVEQPNGSCPTRGVAVPLTFLIGHLHDPVAFPGIDSGGTRT